MDGQALAAILMTELTGARLVGGHGRRRRARAAAGRRSGCATSAPSALLGTAIPRDEAADILRRLEFAVAEAPDGLDVTVPAFRRGDVTREVDLVEEVARLWGLDKLPYTLPSRRGATGVLAPEQRLRRRAEDALAGAGLSEVLGWVFAAPDLVDRLRIPADDPRHGAVVLRNPMSEDMSVMRTTLLGSLLDVARRNRSRGMHDVRLFEIGAIFLAQPRGGEPTAAERRSEPLPEERQHVGALLTGAMRPPSWRERRAAAGRLLRRQGRARGAARRAARAVERRARERAVPAPRPRGARAGRRRAGGLARRDPPGGRARVGPRGRRRLRARPRADRGRGAVRAALRGPDVVPGRAAGPRLVVRAATCRPPTCSPPCATPAGRCCGRARSSTSTRPSDRVSLAVRLEFRADDRTLTDEEVAQRRAKIDAAVAERLGGEPRG